MKRSQLKALANKTKSESDKANYRRQRNLVVNMNRKVKKSYIASLNPAKGTSFWKAIKPLFSDKDKSGDSSFQLLEGDMIVEDNDKIADIFNHYFNTITDSLNIPKWTNGHKLNGNENLENIVDYFSEHPSILAIKQKFPNLHFSFRKVNTEEVCKVVRSLNVSKSVGGKIPVRLLKLAEAQCAPILTSLFNDALETGIFPSELKLADIVPCHKKDATTDKSNFRPVSLLPTIS